jgi:hypothetical protein
LRAPDRALVNAAWRQALVFSGLGSVGVFGRRTLAVTEPPPKDDDFKMLAKRWPRLTALFAMGNVD